MVMVINMHLVWYSLNNEAESSNQVWTLNWNGMSPLATSGLETERDYSYFGTSYICHLPTYVRHLPTYLQPRDPHRAKWHSSLSTTSVAWLSWNAVMGYSMIVLDRRTAWRRKIMPLALKRLALTSASNITGIGLDTLASTPVTHLW